MKYCNINKHNICQQDTPCKIIYVKGPRGANGLQGEPGLPGQNGINGTSDSIIIGETITTESGTPATVEDNFSMGVHTLKFSIPKGADSPTVNLAVAQLNKTTAQTLNAIGQTINFSINQNFRNSRTTQTSIQVLTGGTYKIEYGFTFTSVNELQLVLYVDDLDIRNSILQFNNTTLSNSGVILLELEAQNNISIRVQSITGSAVLSDSIMNGYLIVTPA